MLLRHQIINKRTESLRVSLQLHGRGDWVGGRGVQDIRKSFLTFPSVEMSQFRKTDFYFMFLFWVLLPSIDQYTDIFMIVKLLRGPNPRQNVTSGNL